MLMFLLKCLASTVIVFSSADMISQRNMTVCEKGTVNIVAANKPIPGTYKRIEWLHNDSTILHISDIAHDPSKFGGRMRLWSNGTGLTIVKAKPIDQGTYKRFIIFINGTDDISEFILYVKEFTTRNYNITILKSHSGGITLKCGEPIGLNATYRWIFSNTAGRENETSTGHELPLSPIPQKGSVYCQRESDCTSSLTLSFSSDRQEKVNLCSHGNAVFKWTLRNMYFSLIQWQVNCTTFASTTKTRFVTGSLNISDDYRPRFRLLKQGDVGFQLDNVSRNDAGTYTCIVISQSGGFTIVGDLEVKDQQIGDFNIMVNNQGTLTCGERRDSTYSWIFSNTTGREKETSTGHVLPLSPIPQKGSVYCQRHSDCTKSLTYSFPSAEVPEEGGIHTAAVVVPIVVIIIGIIIIIIVKVIIPCKRRRERERISREAGGGENVSGVEEQML